MIKPRHYGCIKINPPQEAIYARLGYKKGSTRLASAQERRLALYILEALSLIRLKGAALRVPVRSQRGNKTILDNAVTFSSKNLAAFLAGSSEVLLICATAGEIFQQADGRERMLLERRVVYDAVASEMADAALDWIMDSLRKEIRRENKSLSAGRFSAGYGDFPLSAQKKIHNLLDLEKIGITINSRYILKPEKSVTAICAIRENPKK